MKTVSLRLGITRVLSAVLVAALMLCVPSLTAAPSEPPFIGAWEARDTRGGSMTLSITGRAAGPFRVTWKGDVFRQCGDGPGVVHGTGLPSTWKADVLPIQARLECLASHSGLDLPITLRYRPLARTLSVSDSLGQVITWTRPTAPQPAAPPLTVRVNYHDNWVEGFYESGHAVWVTVTRPDGTTPKASLQASTEPKEYWQGETGFNSLDTLWLDPTHTAMELPPDIQVSDWAFAWADNGASAAVQIGEISGVVDAAKDGVTGTVRAPWLGEPVAVECLDWWSGQQGSLKPHPTRAGGFVRPDGTERFSCSWAGEWDIQAAHGIGVGYFDANENWVANAFRSSYFTVFPEPNAVEGWEWPDGAAITATIDSRPACTGRGTAGYSAQSVSATLVWIDFPRGCDVVAGDRVTLTDGTTVLSQTVPQLAITTVDAAAGTVAGIAEDGATVDTWAYDHPNTAMQLKAKDGTWLADFGAAGFDLQGGICGRAETRDAGGNGTAVDWCVPGP